MYPARYSEIKFKSIQIHAKDGFLAYKSADFQPVNLLGGKTTATPSYKISRQSVEIEKAEEGSNVEKAKLSFDDNELSECISKGDISKAFTT